MVIKYSFTTAILLLLFLAPVSSQSQWQNLFNGENMDGWEVQGHFDSQIKNGELHLHATHPFNNAWLLTEKKYRNFVLELEFLMPEGANSGVLFRYNPSLKGMANALGYEANIDWSPDIQYPLGTIEFAARANLLEGLNKLDWNKMTIKANGDHLKVMINETLVCETHNRKSLSGKIGLQAPIKKGDTIAFRGIKLKVLPDTEIAMPPIEAYYRTTFERPLEPLLEQSSIDSWSKVGPGKWALEEGGVLHGYSADKHSFLVSEKTYKNFYLKTKFKIIHEDNSGIFIRKHPDSTGVSTNYSIECNIYDHNGFSHAYSTGSIVFHARAWTGMIDYEDWNTMEIFAHENQIILYVNGQKSAEAYLPESFNIAGHICLQAGTKVFTDNGPSNIYFKDLMIKNMDGL